MNRDLVDCEERVRTRALEVFEDENLVEGWLHSPIPALGGRVPIELVRSSMSECEEILAELVRIEHGIGA